MLILANAYFFQSIPQSYTSFRRLYIASSFYRVFIYYSFVKFKLYLNLLFNVKNLN